MKKYYLDAFEAELKELWKGIELSKDAVELENLAYYRALRSYFSKNENAISDRRSLLYSYLKSECKTTDENDTLNKYKHTLPINSIIHRILNNICQAYTEPPARSFGGGNSEEILTKIFKEVNADVVISEIYKAATLIGCVALRPYFKDGEFKFLFLYPHEYRIIADPNNPNKPQQLIAVDLDYDNNIVYNVYTDNEFFTINSDGDTINRQPNNYGVIPFVFLRLDNENSLYGPGAFELLEAQLNINKLRYLADLDATYNGMPIKIGINLGENALDLSPDKIIGLDGITVESDGQFQTPRVDFFAPPSQYDSLLMYANEKEAQIYRSFGFPASMVGQQAGTQASGVARIIERQEIIEKRLRDIPFLKLFEEKLARLICLVLNTDAPALYNLPLDFDFNIDFAEERIFIEPEAEYNFDKLKMQDGLIDPLHFLHKWSGIDKNMNEIEALDIILKRKSLLAKLGFSNQLAQTVTTNGAQNV